MTAGITRSRALELLHAHVKQPNMIKHSLASEAVMDALAQHLGEDREKWSLAGLLHDLDAETTHGDLAVHGQETVRLLEKESADPELIEAIALHNEVSAGGRKRSTRFQHALAAGETITGLIIATTLVYPDKKINSVKSKSIIKRMKEKAFAASVNRDIILECEKTGIPLESFSEICLRAMQGISKQLEL